MADVPASDAAWLAAPPSLDNATLSRLAEAVDFARASEAPIPRDLAAFKAADNAGEGVHGAIIGPMPPRGPATGLVVHRGRIVAAWGEPERTDIAFSVTKCALSALVGVALGEGRIATLDEPVRQTVDSDAFAGPRNSQVTWRHLLTLTSEWHGTLWGIPDSIDWHRVVGGPAPAGTPAKGSKRELRPPGTFWEYNDVRVNVLALALTRLFGDALEAVLRSRVMDPIGASPAWRWHGYAGAETLIDGRPVPVVAGGAHWGGGLVLSAFDLARLGLLHARDGLWQGRRVLPAGWLEQVRAPSALAPTYGLMWWVNRSATLPGFSPGAIWGAGIANLLLADPERDLVIVLRWFDARQRDALLARFEQALRADEPGAGDGLPARRG